MSKNNFLLVDLNETKTKKLAETITSDTSRKILNYLAEKDHDSESSIAKTLDIPISTVHYHLQKLVEASLVHVEEFHYSTKGREVNHYKLANKYIIIAPKNVSGLREKLKNILPVVLGVAGISAVIKYVQSSNSFIMKKVAFASQEMTADSVAEVIPELMMKAAPQVVETSQPDIALWFLLGGVTVILLYLLVEFIKEKRKK
jgi:predicted ArsR family transcriptional regulator